MTTTKGVVACRRVLDGHYGYEGPLDHWGDKFRDRVDSRWVFGQPVTFDGCVASGDTDTDTDTDTDDADTDDADTTGPATR